MPYRHGAKRLLAKHLGNVPSLEHCPTANIYIYNENIERTRLERFFLNNKRRQDDADGAMAI